jgi:hypothetical protein
MRGNNSLRKMPKTPTKRPIASFETQKNLKFKPFIFGNNSPAPERPAKNSPIPGCPKPTRPLEKQFQPSDPEPQTLNADSCLLSPKPSKMARL